MRPSSLSALQLLLVCGGLAIRAFGDSGQAQTGSQASKVTGSWSLTCYSSDITCLSR